MSIINYHNKTTHVARSADSLVTSHCSAVNDRKSIALRAVANLFTNHRLCPSASRSAGVCFGRDDYSAGDWRRRFLCIEARSSATTSWLDWQVGLAPADQLGPTDCGPNSTIFNHDNELLLQHQHLTDCVRGSLFKQCDVRRWYAPQKHPSQTRCQGWNNL